MTPEKSSMSPVKMLTFWAAAVIGIGSYMYWDAGAPKGAIVAGVLLSLGVTVFRIVQRKNASRPA